MTRSPADLLRACHLAALGLVATWMGAAHGGLLPALVLAAIAASGEGLPRGAWRELGSPALVIAGGIVAWLCGDGERGAMHATLGTLVAALVLVPARPGALRLVAPLCALELVVAGLPQVGVVRPWLAAVVLVPGATLALAIDAWLGARLGTRPAPAARLAALRWALAPAAAAAVLGVLAFAPAQRVAEAIGPGASGRPGGRPDPTIRTIRGPHPGDAVGISPGGPPPRDPTATARLFLAEDPHQLVYLRLAACSRLQRDQGRWRWLPAPGEVELAAAPPPKQAPIAQLVRMPGWGDTVLAPDDGGWVGMDGLYADGDGNRWRTGLSDAIRSYPVALADAPRQEAPEDRAAVAAICREIPPGMQDWPWSLVERPEWRDLPPAVAARRIGETLQGRCVYDLEVPTPPAGADPLAAFMFSEDVRLRRGICEHFAGATALLLRRAGHAARCVAGFASAEWDGSGIVFRRLHAHAWVEILDEEGRWLRAPDPTPPVAHELIAKLPTSDAPPPDPARSVPLAPPAARHEPGWWPWLLVAGAAFAIATAVHLRRQRRLAPYARDAQAAHRRRGEELVRIAQAVGVRVAPGDTATTICARIAERTGTDLSAHLERYEAARFGRGPDPGPWPEIRTTAGAVTGSR